MSRRWQGHYRTEAARRRALANLRPGPKAEAGNQIARRHGAYAAVSDAERDQREREVFAALAADAPLRERGELPAADALVVGLLAEAMVRLERVRRHHRDFGWLDPKTREPRASVALQDRLTRQALDLARELGMTPASRAKLGVDLQRGVDLAQQAAEDFERERREGGGDG